MAAALLETGATGIALVDADHAGSDPIGNASPLRTDDDMRRRSSLLP